MRISELAERSGVPTATIKYYVRERLLPEGVRTSATQARYLETHLTRLRLIRALAGPAGLSIAQIRDVLASIDFPPESTHDLLGVATDAVQRPVTDSVDLTRVHELMARWGWTVDAKDCAAQEALEAALAAADSADFPLEPEQIDFYRQHMEAIAEREVEGVPTDSVAAAVRYVTLGTVLVEPILLALRRMAQQEASARRFNRPAPG